MSNDWSPNPKHWSIFGWAIAGFIGYRLYKAYVGDAPSFGQAVNPKAPQGAK